MKEKEREKMNFEDYPITEEEVVSILGSGYKTQGNELVWRCPSCASRGGDMAGDNLKFNREKQILKCFACDFAEEVVGIISRRRFEKSRGIGEGSSAQTYVNYVAPPIEPKDRPEREKEIEQEKLLEYYWDCHLNLMKHKDILKKMYEKHTIMPMTAVECMIGYDGNKDMLVFPSVAAGKSPTKKYMSKPNGAEYREYEGEKTIRRISGYNAKICHVYCECKNPTIGIICEGYKDAYNLVQLLKMIDKNKLNKTSIFTVQNGTNSINFDNCLQKVNWREFKEIGVLLDNDDAGTKATKIAMELFSNIKDLRKTYLDGYNDIQERFKTEYGSMIDIDKALRADWLEEYQNE